MILIDTSVYISAMTDPELEKALIDVSKKSIIMSSVVVEKEITKASGFLRRTYRKENSEKLKELYNTCAGGKIGITPFVLRLSDEYFAAVKQKYGRSKAEGMIEDFRIVSAASAAALATVATFNRKTMGNEEIIEIYKSVNKKHKLKTPHFIRSKSELIGFLSSS
ncbi:MAG: hypothetical protein QMD85_04265 [Candidatus Aenigmarchaeota archaeon]|nr:hypothetical protein [Candidatus Aenigmarchaeota archaeon]MDI6722786.1 hypothetical protein [Candidatus Aenigmarchaeota archaeon]